MTPRMSADARRRVVVEAAMREFAQTGLNGTSTEAVAARAGISQPYLFRLFDTKKALFIAAVEHGFSLVEQRFAEVGEGLTGAAAMQAMGAAYNEIVTDRELLFAQLHSYAACGDDEIRAAVHRSFSRLWATVARISGAEPAKLLSFFATGMFLNVITVTGLTDIGAVGEWCDAMLENPGPAVQHEGAHGIDLPHAADVRSRPGGAEGRAARQSGRTAAGRTG